MDSNKTGTYIEAYYTTNQRHVAWSFWASLAALVVGLVVLVTGISLALGGYETTMSITTVAAGVLTQFISAGFFFLYNRNLQQLNIFYEKLVQNHDLMFAFGLTGHIPPERRSGVIEGIIGALLTRSAPSSELTADLVRALNERRA